MTLKPHDWSILSRNERVVTYQGRHFFAVRCGRSGNGLTWAIDEHDVDITTSETGARQIDRPVTGVETRGLSAAIIELVKAPKPTGRGHRWFTIYGFTSCGLCYSPRTPEALSTDCGLRPIPRLDMLPVDPEMDR
jgi:hypothetical protein